MAALISSRLYFSNEVVQTSTNYIAASRPIPQVDIMIGSRQGKRGIVRTYRSYLTAPSATRVRTQAASLQLHEATEFRFLNDDLTSQFYGSSECFTLTLLLVIRRLNNYSLPLAQRWLHTPLFRLPVRDPHRAPP